jgi:hypothetical protein
LVEQLTQLYNTLTSLNPNPDGVHPPISLATLKDQANKLNKPGFFDDGQEQYEATQMRNLLPSEFPLDFHPENPKQPLLGSDLVGNIPNMPNLIRKIKNGDGKCCLPDK